MLVKSNPSCNAGLLSRLWQISSVDRSEFDEVIQISSSISELLSGGGNTEASLRGISRSYWFRFPGILIKLWCEQTQSKHWLLLSFNMSTMTDVIGNNSKVSEGRMINIEPEHKYSTAQNLNPSAEYFCIRSVSGERLWAVGRTGRAES